MKRKVLIALIVCLSAIAANANASLNYTGVFYEDSSWSGFARLDWAFDAGDVLSLSASDSGAEATITPQSITGNWNDSYSFGGAAQGIYELDNTSDDMAMELSIDFPSDSTAREIIVQVAYFQMGYNLSGAPDMQPVISSSDASSLGTVKHEKFNNPNQFSDAWVIYSTKWNVSPDENGKFELSIAQGSDTSFIDRVVVDVADIPEPISMSIFAFGALFIRRK